MSDTTLKVLIVGAGGREHALAWRCAYEGHEVIVAPGNDGIAEDARCEPVSVSDQDGQVALAKRENVDLVIVGPEQPLVDGLADRLREAGITTLGPSAAAAALEGSKAHAKDFMQRHGIPTAAYENVSDLEAGLAAIRRFSVPPVVKASGLAAGKGVVVPESYEEAEAALRDCMEADRFGSAGSTVVLEERLVGQEVSFFAITDGSHVATLDASQDHKRLLDRDEGPNTGGMGAYTHPPVCTDAVRERILDRVVVPTLEGLRDEGTPFCGILFCGLMVDDAGDPKVIEYNVRFGDPEAQPLMLGLRDPITPVFLAAARGDLAPTRLAGDPAATIVLASAGYPATSTKGVAIEGLPAASSREGVKVFHAGTRKDAEGVWRTNGGRVLGFCAKGDALETAIGRAYNALECITSEGSQFRRDIGWRGL